MGRRRRAGLWTKGRIESPDALEQRGDPPGYHLLPAARAQLLERLSRWPEVADAYGRALTLVTNAAERRSLERRMAHLAQPS